MLNRNLAKYIESVVKQRERARTKLVEDYGSDSAAVTAADGEIAELRTYSLKLQTYGNETVTVDGEPVLPEALRAKDK